MPRFVCVLRRYLFRTVILLRSYENLLRPQDQQPTPNPRRNLNLLRFYPTLKVYQRFFAAAYNNKAFAPYLNLTQPFGLTYGKVYIGETGRAMQDRIKEHDRDIRLAHTQTSAVSEHAVSKHAAKFGMPCNIHFGRDCCIISDNGAANDSYGKLLMYHFLHNSN